MRWLTPSPDDATVSNLSRQCQLSAVAARLLAGRGFRSSEDTEAFLSPGLGSLSDPLLPGRMQEAVERLELALKREESVLIFGDYDVDGVTSTVFLTHFLRRFGLNPRYVVPKRLEEGYGLSIESLQRALEKGKPDLLIAVDCGTGSSTEVAWLRERDISVIILDHHASKESLPEDCILMNPHVHDAEDAPWKNLCAVGLVFKFCHAFLKVMRAKADPLAAKTDLREYLDLVAMGTVADLVPLEGENRILVRQGLRHLQQCRRPGICALIEAAGLNLGDKLTPVDIGFRLGPRINAGGRLDEATLPIRLLLEEDSQFCKGVAKKLDAFNRERQEIERGIALMAERAVKETFPEDTGIVVASGDWHAGVVGIVASRLARQFNRPTLVLGSENDGFLKGSGRSVEGVNLVEILNACSGHIQQWGGHPMAVGLTVAEEEVPHLRAAFNAALDTLFPKGLPEPSLQVDAWARPDELTEDLLQELDRISPFGMGNPEPVFALKGVEVATLNPMGKLHLRFTLRGSNGQLPLEGMSWNGSDNPPPLDSPIDMAVRFAWNVWRGERTPRITLLDWRN
ncbi:MAG TPA: single-stranded-DNA-specific exonuclease RecJ [Oceanipulchritudo sp.]|nr:single-stranded-DNA-specific exonuclease RecJ [Oceanipulchritudo sp.]